MNSNNNSPILGYVSESGGYIQVKSSDGTVREVQPGDPIFSDDIISNLSNGDMIITTTDNQNITIAQSQILQITSDLLERIATRRAEAQEEEESDIDAEIQRLVENNVESNNLNKNQEKEEFNELYDNRLKTGVKLDERNEQENNVITLQESDDSSASEQAQRDDGVSLNDDVVQVPVNHRPTLVNQDFNINENSPTDGSSIVGAVIAQDRDGQDKLEYSIVAGNEEGKFSINPDNGEITVEGDLNYESVASYRLTVQVTDDGIPPLSTTGIVTININDVNETPDAQADEASGSENEVLIIDVLANDTDVDQGDNPSNFTIDAVEIVDEAGNSVTNKGSVTITSNRLEYNPGTDFDALDVGDTSSVLIHYVMSDDDGLSSEATVRLSITGTNDAPIAEVDLGDTTENSAVTVDVIANDRDLDATDVLTVSAASIGTMTNDANDEAVNLSTASVTFDGREVSFTPGDDFNYLATGETATVVINYTVTDDNGNPLTDDGTLTVTVTGTNDAPVAEADLGDTTENSAVTVDVIANDSDLDVTDVLTVSAASISTMTNDADDETVTLNTASVTFDGREISFTPGDDFNYLATGETATVVINYTVTDDDGNPLTDDGTLTVTVTGTNDAPVAEADLGDTTENSAVTVDVIANDSDLDVTDVLTVSAASISTMTNDADNETVTLSTASVTFDGREVSFTPGD
ncbi:MAG: Ig-like domain-containing protein, partial [Endozoicomonas sp. (ex Botrylloides leachii)]|nr:Ig-like domain-containing protein [Endozoicomonas sp. (ex Botrylloides leachii)]